LTQYTNASFSLESSSPIIYSGKLQSNGYFSAPSDVYFIGDFTITALVNVISTKYYSRLIDFGNGGGYDNILLALSFYDYGEPLVRVYKDMDYDAMSGASSQALVVSQWTHVASILQGNNISVYLNCTLTHSEPITFLPRDVVRTSNLIGKSNWFDVNANAKFRNLRIYNRALSQSELRTDFNNQ
jgi:hypothetical protein